MEVHSQKEKYVLRVKKKKLVRLVLRLFRLYFTAPYCTRVTFVLYTRSVIDSLIIILHTLAVVIV